MAYNFSTTKQNIKDIEEWLKRELSGIRTGRATIAILDGVKVSAYGSDMPVNQVANISIEDARVIRITPWDASQIKAIEKAIIVSDLGLSVVVDGTGLRVIFPELTGDRRVALVKIAKQKLEDAKVSVRTEREKALKDLEAEQKAGTISEDEKFRLKTDVQKIVDDSGRSLDELFNKKEKEILD